MSSLSLASLLHQLVHASFPSLSLSSTGWPVHLCHCHLRQLAVVIGVVPQWHWPLVSPPPPHPCRRRHCVAMTLAICVTFPLSLWHHRVAIMPPLLYRHGAGHPVTSWLTCGGPWLLSTLVVVAVDTWWWSRHSCGPGIALCCLWQKNS